MGFFTLCSTSITLTMIDGYSLNLESAWRAVAMPCRLKHYYFGKVIILVNRPLTCEEVVPHSYRLHCRIAYLFLASTWHGRLNWNGALGVHCPGPSLSKAITIFSSTSISITRERGTDSPCGSLHRHQGARSILVGQPMHFPVQVN